MRRLQRPIPINLYYDYSHAIIFGVCIAKRLAPGLCLIPRIGSAGTSYLVLYRYGGTHAESSTETFLPLVSGPLYLSLSPCFPAFSKYWTCRRRVKPPKKKKRGRGKRRHRH